MEDLSVRRVQLDELTLIQFRNSQRIQFSPIPRFNIISGRNGMGKTNLIEAIYLMGALRSFRTTVRTELIAHHEEAARIRGVFGQSLSGLRCEITIEKNKRTVSLDGKAVTRTGDYFRNLPMVLFHPGNMELVQGGPETRRRFLDRALFQADVSYPELHRNYSAALANRNGVLRHRPVDVRSLPPFDLQLAEYGSRIVSIRRDFVAQMKEAFETAVGEISGEGVGKMEYCPRIEGSVEEFMAMLQDKRRIDCDRGFTTYGPHADDILFEIDKRQARRFASQGQQRTLVLAAKIAETRALAKSCGKIPLLLLDDVSSELDRDRNRQLFHFLSTMGGQVFITTTHSDHIPIETDRVDMLMDNGRLIPA